MVLVVILLVVKKTRKTEDISSRTSTKNSPVLKKIRTRYKVCIKG